MEDRAEESLESRVVGVAVVILSENLFRDLTGIVGTGGGAITESVTGRGWWAESSGADTPGPVLP